VPSERILTGGVTRKKRPPLLDIATHAFLLAAGVAIALLIFHFVFMPIVVNQGQEVVVPDVVGLSVGDARQILQQVSLDGAVISERINPEWPRGTVLEQDPPAQLRTRKERGVGLIVSLGRGEVQIPNVVGESLRHAELILARDGIPVGNVSRRPGEEPAEQVLELHPTAGSTCIRGLPVDVLVSAGPGSPAYLMPDFRGADAEEIAAALRRNGFLVEVVYPVGAISLGGGVVSQIPAPGHRLIAGEPVKLMVGEGM